MGGRWGVGVGGAVLYCDRAVHAHTPQSQTRATVTRAKCRCALDASRAARRDSASGPAITDANDDFFVPCIVNLSTAHGRAALRESSGLQFTPAPALSHVDERERRNQRLAAQTRPCAIMARAQTRPGCPWGVLGNVQLASSS